MSARNASKLNNPVSVNRSPFFRKDNTAGRYSKVTSKHSNPFEEEESINFNVPAILSPNQMIIAGQNNPFDETPIDEHPTKKQPSIRAFLNRNQTKKGYNPFGNGETDNSANAPPTVTRPTESTTIPPTTGEEDGTGVEMTSLEYQRQVEKSKKKRTKFRQNLRTMEVEFHNDGSENQTEVCINPEQENAIIRFLVAKRVYGYPGTNGTIWSNYRHYVCNNHPFLSMCFLHPLNSFGRKERIIVYMNSIFFTIFVTFVIMNTTYIPRLSMCRFGCNDQIVPAYYNQTICIGGYNDGVSYESYHRTCYYYQPWMLSALAGLLVVIYQSTLEFLGTCGCVQGRKSFQNNCVGNRCKACIEWFGGSILTFCTLVSLILLLWTMIAIYVLQIDYNIVADILVSKVWSFGEWFIWSAPYFSYRYPGDKKQFYQRLLRKQKNSRETNSQLV